MKGFLLVGAVAINLDRVTWMQLEAPHWNRQGQEPPVVRVYQGMIVDGMEQYQEFEGDEADLIRRFIRNLPAVHGG